MLRQADHDVARLIYVFPLGLELDCRHALAEPAHFVKLRFYDRLASAVHVSPEAAGVRDGAEALGEPSGIRSRNGEKYLALASQIRGADWSIRPAIHEAEKAVGIIVGKLICNLSHRNTTASAIRPGVKYLAVLAHEDQSSIIPILVRGATEHAHIHGGATS